MPFFSDVVRRWLDAANRQDVDALLALSDPDIEVVGPRGSARGHQALREWLARAGLALETRRAFSRADVVVLAQHGVWRSPRRVKSSARPTWRRVSGWAAGASSGTRGTTTSQSR